MLSWWQLHIILWCRVLVLKSNGLCEVKRWGVAAAKSRKKRSYQKLYRDSQGEKRCTLTKSDGKPFGGKPCWEKKKQLSIFQSRKHTGLNFLWNLISKRSPEYMLQFFLNLLGKNGNEVGLVFPSSIVVCFSEDVNMWTRLERNVFFFVFAFLQKWNKLSLLFLCSIKSCTSIT